jgi:orotate phosphoribosyltransferase
MVDSTPQSIPSLTIGTGSSDLNDAQRQFITFLVRNKVLLFGDFVTKSGRQSPFFLNFGQVFEGEQVQTLGTLYAKWIVQEFGRQSFVIFGPAYKGIPLAVATTIALAEMGCQASYLFNRKEAKQHGETGTDVGKMPSAGDVVIIVDDVVTAGLTLKEIIPRVKELSTDANFEGVVVGVDRNERGVASSARLEAEREFNTHVRPIVSIIQIIEYLSNPNPSGKVLSDGELKACRSYLNKFGAN